MRFYIILAASIMLLSACTDNKQQEKDSLNQVLKIHDEAMAKSEQVMKNKLLLDSVAKTKNAADNVKASAVINNLLAADKAMEDWMHQFNADYTGKSHDEIMSYLADQKKKVDLINNQLNSAVSQSTQFITTIKK